MRPLDVAARRDVVSRRRLAIRCFGPINNDDVDKYREHNIEYLFGALRRRAWRTVFRLR